MLKKFKKSNTKQTPEWNTLNIPAYTVYII